MSSTSVYGFEVEAADRFGAVSSNTGLGAAVSSLQVHPKAIHISANDFISTPEQKFNKLFCFFFITITITITTTVIILPILINGNIDIVPLQNT